MCVIISGFKIIIIKKKLTAKRDGVDEESMLLRGPKPWLLALLAGLAAGKTGVTGALPRRSPQAFSYDVSVKE